MLKYKDETIGIGKVDLSDVDYAYDNGFVSRNLFDEQMEIGGIDTTSGASVTYATRMRSVNYTEIDSTKSYYICTQSTVSTSATKLRIFYYNSSKTFISYQDWTYTLTIPSGAKYIRFITIDGYGTTYNNDIILNVSDSKNGIYQPYAMSNVELTEELSAIDDNVDSGFLQKNLFDGTLYNGNFIDANFNREMTTSNVYMSCKLYLKKGTYTFSCAKNINVVRVVKDGVYTSGGLSGQSSFSFTCTTDGYVGFSWRDATSSSTVWDISTHIQIEKGSQATDYVPYAKSNVALTEAFKVVTTTYPTTGSVTTEVDLPSGYTKDNCMILSATVYVGNSLYEPYQTIAFGVGNFEDNLPTRQLVYMQGEKLMITVSGTIPEIYSGATVKVLLYKIA